MGKTKIEVTATGVGWDDPKAVLHAYPVLSERFNAKTVRVAATEDMPAYRAVVVEIDGLAGLRDLAKAVGHSLVVGVSDDGSGALLSADIYDNWRE